MKGVIAAPICIGLLQLPSKVLYLAVGGQSGVVSCLHAPETTWPPFQTGQMYVSLEKLEELFTKNFPSCVEEASNGGRLSLALPQFLDLSRCRKLGNSGQGQGAGIDAGADRVTMPGFRRRRGQRRR